MNPKRIVIDGKTYNSVDEMPEDVRRNYEQAMRGFKEVNTNNISGALDDVKNILADKDNNGVPDVMENNQVINISGGTKFVVDGKVINNVDDLPPDARAKYEQAMGSLDRNRNGMPDILEGMMNVSNQTPQPSMNARDHSRDTTRHSKPLLDSAAIAPESSNGWMLALAGALLLFLCVAGAIGVWYFFIR